MGNEAAKAIVPVVVQGLPVIIKAIKGDDNNRPRTTEDRRILEALEIMQRNRDDVDRLLQNQHQLIEAFRLLGERVQEGGRNSQLQNGTCDQLDNGANNQGRIRIEMELPENAEEREEALRRFWITLSDHASALKCDSKNGSAQGERPAISSSAPPSPSDESPQELNKLDSFLYCEICTQRYNTTDRRPTLLPSCGHTFCKDCLRKANRRNHRCPHCRQITNINVDEHPTNFAILDFLKESEEGSKLKKKEEKMDANTPDLTFEEQLEIARQLSLEESRVQQNNQEQQNRQEEEDRHFALQLQREEERLRAFRYHEDGLRKHRSLNDSQEFMNNHADHVGSPTREHNNVLREENHIRDRDGNISDDDDDDIYDDCHAVLRPNRTTYDDACQALEEVDDRKKSCDSEEDCHLRSVENGYSNARHLLDDVDDAKNCSGSDDECLKSGKGEEGNNESLLGEERCEGDSNLNESICESGSLYQQEMEFMLHRAEDTHKRDKEHRRKNRRLKEQEEMDLAMALSLSLCETQMVSASQK